MNKQQTKPPMCNDCCGAKATRRPWRGRGAKYNQRHLKKATHSGEAISVDQLESSIPGFIGQMTRKLTKQCTCKLQPVLACTRQYGDTQGSTTST
jgi:hypothetical protein